MTVACQFDLSPKHLVARLPDDSREVHDPDLYATVLMFRSLAVAVYATRVIDRGIAPAEVTRGVLIALRDCKDGMNRATRKPLQEVGPPPLLR